MVEDLGTSPPWSPFVDLTAPVSPGWGSSWALSPRSPKQTIQVSDMMIIDQTVIGKWKGRKSHRVGEDGLAVNLKSEERKGAA